MTTARLLSQSAWRLWSTAFAPCRAPLAPSPRCVADTRVRSPKLTPCTILCHAMSGMMTHGPNRCLPLHATNHRNHAMNQWDHAMIIGTRAVGSACAWTALCLRGVALCPLYAAVDVI